MAGIGKYKLSDAIPEHLREGGAEKKGGKATGGPNSVAGPNRGGKVSGRDPSAGAGRGKPKGSKKSP